jgi:hypothetical protein
MSVPLLLLSLAPHEKLAGAEAQRSAASLVAISAPSEGLAGNHWVSVRPAFARCYEASEGATARAERHDGVRSVTNEASCELAPPRRDGPGPDRPPLRASPGARSCASRSRRRSDRERRSVVVGRPQAAPSRRRLVLRRQPPFALGNLESPRMKFLQLPACEQPESRTLTRSGCCRAPQTQTCSRT